MWITNFNVCGIIHPAVIAGLDFVAKKANITWIIKNCSHRICGTSKKKLDDDETVKDVACCSHSGEITWKKRVQ